MKNEILRMEFICKSFSGVRVLKNICLNVFEGEVLGVIGENGAGKSTLICILDGITETDTGRIIFLGREAQIHSPNEARKQGIYCIHQDGDMLQNMTVAENMHLAKINDQKHVWINKKEVINQAEATLKKIDIDLKATEMGYNLRIAQRAQLHVAMAVHSGAQLIVMDQISESMDKNEQETLRKIVKAQRDQGKSVIYITNNVDEAMRFADRIVVIKEGVNVGVELKEQFSRDKLQKMMLINNKPINIAQQEEKFGKVVMKVSALCAKRAKNISFSLRRGEVFGIAGISGSGRTAILDAIFGMVSRTGNVWVDGKILKPMQPKASTKAGLAYITSDVLRYDVVQKMSIEDNLSLCALDKVSKHGIMCRRIQHFLYKEYTEKLHITKGIKWISMLSSGNIQKIVIAKWLISNPCIVLMNEPLNGLDAKARNDVFSLVMEMAQKGMGVIYVSSELQDMLKICDRIMLMRSGRVIKTVNNLKRDVQIEEIRMF